MMNIIFTSFVDKFIHSCPKNLYDNVFSDLMTPLIKLTKERLEKGWENIILTNNG